MALPLPLANEVTPFNSNGLKSVAVDTTTMNHGGFVYSGSCVYTLIEAMKTNYEQGKLF